jgi:excisionase family DNA binding protein
MNKEDAAKFLNIGVRSLERYTTQGRVAFQKVKGKTGPVVDYEAAELERFKAELEAPPPVSPVPPNEETALAHIRPASLAKSAASSARGRNEGRESAAFIAAQVVQASAVKLLLTIDEAAAYAGVGRGAIERTVKDGTLKAHRGLAQGRRIRRADLETWVENL